MHTYWSGGPPSIVLSIRAHSEVRDIGWGHNESPNCSSVQKQLHKLKYSTSNHALSIHSSMVIFILNRSSTGIIGPRKERTACMHVSRASKSWAGFTCTYEHRDAFSPAHCPMSSPSNSVELLYSYVSVNPSFNGRTFDSFSMGLGTYIPASASGEANAEGGNLPKVLGNAEIRRDEFGEFGFVSMYYFTHHKRTVPCSNTSAPKAKTAPQPQVGIAYPV